ADELVALLGAPQLNGLDGTGADVQSNQRSLFPRAEHIAASPGVLCDRLASRSGARLVHFLLHPAVQDGFAKLPTIAQLERGHQTLADIAVKRVPGNAQVLGRLPDVHDLPNLTHRGVHPGLESSQWHSSL